MLRAVTLVSLLQCIAFTACAQTAVQQPQQPSAPAPASAPAKELRAPDVMFVPTPYEVVEAMLNVAKVGKGDVLYDLGSGDGRIPIMAAQKYNIERGVGIDINPERIKEAQAAAKTAGVTNRVRFTNADLFETDISDATVVTLYLLPALNLKLLPKLLKDLKPGTRIVSHAFDMGTWKPEQALNIGGRSVYYWTTPAPG
ncbi:MAG: SAM-dependent methyltransferase, partial [Burkholderiaceae bacterium]